MKTERRQKHSFVRRCAAHIGACYVYMIATCPRLIKRVSHTTPSFRWTLNMLCQTSEVKSVPDVRCSASARAPLATLVFLSKFGTRCHVCLDVSVIFCPLNGNVYNELSSLPGNNSIIGNKKHKGIHQNMYACIAQR